MKQLAWISIICMGLALNAACGGDDDDDDDVVTPDAAAGTIDAAPTPDGTPGVIDAPGLTRTEAFCAGVEAVCGFGGADRYTDVDDCKSEFDGYGGTRKDCVEMHLGLAPANVDFHCPHVAGAAPCA